MNYEINKSGQRITMHNSTFAICGVSCSADSFVLNQTLVLCINICGENRTFAKPENVVGHALNKDLD